MGCAKGIDRNLPIIYYNNGHALIFYVRDGILYPTHVYGNTEESYVLISLLVPRASHTNAT